MFGEIHYFRRFVGRGNGAFGTFAAGTFCSPREELGTDRLCRRAAQLVSKQRNPKCRADLWLNGPHRIRGRRE